MDVPEIKIKKNPAAGILDLVGGTPLFRLKRIMPDSPPEVFVKPEYMNPMGSIKDRIAKYMIDKAESEGRISPGDTIIDNSSGNTALGLAMVCAVKGYALKIVVCDSIRPEKIRFLEAMNADAIQDVSTLHPDSPDSYNNITPRLAKDLPGAHCLDQHNCLDNNETHYMTTGPEIWEQMDGKIGYLAAGIGTGGTYVDVHDFSRKGIRISGSLESIQPDRSSFLIFKQEKRFPHLLICWKDWEMNFSSDAWILV